MLAEAQRMFSGMSGVVSDSELLGSKQSAISDSALPAYPGENDEDDAVNENGSHDFLPAMPATIMGMNGFKAIQTGTPASLASQPSLSSQRGFGTPMAAGLRPESEADAESVHNGQDAHALAENWQRFAAGQQHQRTSSGPAGVYLWPRQRLSQPSANASVERSHNTQPQLWEASAHVYVVVCAGAKGSGGKRTTIKVTRAEHERKRATAQLLWPTSAVPQGAPAAVRSV
jgi:hypothetical protein